MAPGGSDKLVNIGHVLKARGLRGELRIRLMAGFLDELAGCEVLVGREPDLASPMSIERATESGPDAIIKFAGVDDRTSAEALEKSDLFLRESELPRLPEGSFYPHELIGVEVTDESGAVLGTLARIEHYPAQDVLVIASGGAAFMAPAVREYFVSFDRDARRLVLRLPEGMPEYSGEL